MRLLCKNCWLQPDSHNLFHGKHFPFAVFKQRPSKSVFFISNHFIRDLMLSKQEMTKILFVASSKELECKKSNSCFFSLFSQKRFSHSWCSCCSWCSCWCYYRICQSNFYILWHNKPLEWCSLQKGTFSPTWRFSPLHFYSSEKNEVSVSWRVQQRRYRIRVNV
jgi:hypothetical protein